mmetsp:Transcript_124092/g.397113  ORF Transcript_124092/g.397113 Transcript_124092/m.397113 type:complete len:1364 (+) Transcript_124092:73-4164(+)
MGCTHSSSIRKHEDANQRHDRSPATSLQCPEKEKKEPPRLQLLSLPLASSSGKSPDRPVSPSSPSTSSGAAGSRAAPASSDETNHRSSSSSSPAPLLDSSNARGLNSDTDTDDDSSPAVPAELATPGQAPSSRLRLFRAEFAPKTSPHYLGRTRSRGGFGRSDSAAASLQLRQQLESGTQLMSEATLQSMLSVSKKKAWGGSEASSECPPVFGFDCAGAALESAAGGQSCGICMCEPEDARLWSLCRNDTCSSRFCGICVGRYATTKVEEALHFVPSLRCPGCWCRISTSAWRPFVPEQTRTKYVANASALLTVRCARCDGTHSLLVEDSEDLDGCTAREDAIMSRVLKEEPEDSHELRRAWREFSMGQSHADQLLGKLVDTAEQTGLSADGPEGALEGQLSAALRLFLMELIALVTDIERRVTLHLAVLRRYPKIRTKCCGQKMCYKCKVKGWHPKVSCEDRQRRFLTIDAVGIQPCPMCGVPTQKTEGCNEVRCVCGHTWSWSEKAGAVPGGVPAISVALGMPASGPELMSTLLRYRADLAASSQDGWGVFHHAAAQRQRMQFRAGGASPSVPPHNDATRLEALLALGGVAEELKDTPDHDGDTGLSVALAHDNLEGARLLIKRGVKLHPEVLTSLHDFASPRSAAEACELLRPCASQLEHAPGMLWFWVEVGLVDHVRAALEAGEIVETDSVAALVLLRAAKEAGAQVATISASLNAVEDLLRKAAEKTGASWADLQRSGATALVRREVRLASFEHRQFDLPLLAALLHQRADPQATVDISRAGDGGRNTVPVLALAAGTDPRQQSGAEISALKMLLEASASPNMPDGGGDPPLWWAISRPNRAAIEVLLTHGATWPSDCRRFAHLLQRISDRRALAGVVEALAPILLTVEGLGTSVPLWLRFLGPGGAAAAREGAAALAGGQRGPRSLDEVAVSMSLLLDRPSGDASSSGCDLLAKEVKAAAGAEVWESLEKNASTALLLKELRGAHLDDRDLDLELVQMLLRRGADVNASQQSVRSGAFQREWGEEDFTPLVLLANASEVSAASAASAVKLLVESMADIEKADADGDTALTWAVMKHNVPVVQALCEAGATLGQSLVEEEGSPLAAVSHPAVLRPIAAVLAPRIRATLEDFPSPPLWLVVQFGTPQALRKLLQQPEAPTVSAVEVEALLRRRLQGGGLTDGSRGGGTLEDVQVATELRSAAVQQQAAGAAASASSAGEPPGGEPETAAQLWKSLLADAATALLRQEVEGAFEGSFALDLGFVEALLSLGAEPNLQVVVGEEVDDEGDEDSDLEFEEAEEEDEELDEGEDEDDENKEDLGADDEGGDDGEPADSDDDDGTEIDAETHGSLPGTEVKLRL